jgi:hypothetical protein
MAEGLIKFTAFRREFSTSAETVGEPVKVAMISKSEGFALFVPTNSENVNSK